MHLHPCCAHSAPVKAQQKNPPTPPAVQVPVTFAQLPLVSQVATGVPWKPGAGQLPVQLLPGSVGTQEAQTALAGAVGAVEHMTAAERERGREGGTTIISISVLSIGLTAKLSALLCCRRQEGHLAGEKSNDTRPLQTPAPPCSPPHPAALPNKAHSLGEHPPVTGFQAAAVLQVALPRGHSSLQTPYHFSLSHPRCS